MKIFKFIAAFALTLGFAACDNFDLPNPPGQNFPEPDGYFEDAGLKMTAANTSEKAINLIECNAANEFATVANIDELVNFPEGYDLVVNMEVGSDDQFSKVSTIGTTITADNVVTVNPDIFNTAIQEVITRAPGDYNVPVRFAAYASRGTTNMRLGGLDKYFGQGLLAVHTLDAQKVIEDAYYVVPCNESGVPQFAQAMKMNNTGGNVSPYDNPEFALKFDVPADAQYRFVIASQSTVTAKDPATVYGCNEAADGMGGKLGVGYSAGLMPINGAVFVTINMELDSYSISYAFDVLYPFSGSTKVENLMLLYTENYINYTGVTAINRQWILAGQPDKEGPIAFRQDPESEPEISEDGLCQTGNMTNGEGKMLTAPFKGNSLYWADVNLVQQTYAITAIRSISVIGAHNGWNLETALEQNSLTASKDLRTWTATDVKLGGEFKLNCNGDWTISFGGSEVPDVLGQHVYHVANVAGGGNLSVEEGTYDVELNFSSMPYTLTLKKK